MIIEMREPRNEDAVRILPYLRPRESSFLLEKSVPPSEIIMDEVARSILAYTITVDRVPAIMWGARLASMLDSRAYVWMLGTVLIDEHPIAFLRHSRRAMLEAVKRFGALYGLVERDFVDSERWLKWMGCELIEGEGPHKYFVLREGAKRWHSPR